MNIDALLLKVIPPSDFAHRDGFSNTAIIDKLNKSEKKVLEDALIQKLINETDKNADTLIIDTLSYMHSEKAIPVLNHFLKALTNDYEIIVIGVALFKLTQNHTLISKILYHFKNIDNPTDPYAPYKIIMSLPYLSQIKTEEIKQIIAGYLDHTDYTVSYNAKRAIDAWNWS